MKKLFTVLVLALLLLTGMAVSESRVPESRNETDHVQEQEREEVRYVVARGNSAYVVNVAAQEVRFEGWKTS